ncbi:hypothetical protein O181_033447 [Austropuccinia psidii MF-1]|uniref:Uncharacterized protein n=1 Tax=Austropuccinia psidii MF-1 TaxID=1389203 RepID=A0A9Q3D1F0_9BASI|nr:hypothetical protein [Austropuccinia psidii MF-1]
MWCMEDTSSYAKDKWDKSHTTPDFKVRDLVLVSTTQLNNFKGFKKLTDYFAGPFVMKALVTGALRSEEGLALSKLGLTYRGLKDMVRRDTLKSVKDELLKE